MALQGEGDPRWVVRERDDGRNVNGWHWEDKDVTGWAKERLKQLIATDTCAVAHAQARVAVDSVTSVDGDATLYNRKGVLKVLYDLKVVGKWTTLQSDKSDRTFGEFKFELFDEDPEISVTLDSKSRGVAAFKNAFVSDVVPLIRKQCVVFISEMHAGAGQSVEGLTMRTKNTTTETKVTDFLRSGMDEKPKKKTTPKNGELVLTDKFNCKPTDMYLALTDRGRLEAITRARAISEPTTGGKVVLMGGTVVGSYKKLLIGKEIDMDWKLRTWGEDAAMGKATVSMEEDEGKTEVEVRIKGVPNEQRSATEGFWRAQIFQAMKVVMGWGSASQFL